MTKLHRQFDAPLCGAGFLALLFFSGRALAQVPVIDNATLTQAEQTASNTAAIMDTNRQILDTVNQTLQAVTGDRSTGNIGSSAIGNGFSMSSAPDFSSLLGGQLSLGALGSFGNVAGNFINGLNLVKNLSGVSGSSALAPDQSYLASVNTATAMAGIVAGQQAASTARVASFTAAGSQIGTAGDIKGSIDQNSQLQVQTGLTVNELIGTMNGVNATLNAQQVTELTAQSETAKVLRYDPSAASLVR